MIGGIILLLTQYLHAKLEAYSQAINNKLSNLDKASNCLHNPVATLKLDGSLDKTHATHYKIRDYLFQHLENLSV